ncbi:major facilitator superfamily domain-containing protein [Fusarium mundagurra]|uniref:Molybdate-anion transporter n=1 Tax=Fusarium mundagurra TaxID=1567541 RepID=A0A8H5YYS4_9HYPO|nr:major facilitator superfamily domain-containing protein [Fusarium mundagurra]
MDHYTITLIIFIIPLIFVSYWHHRHVTLKVVRASAAEARRLDMIDDEIHDIDHESMGERYYSFRNKFLWAYGLAMAAEWLQAENRGAPGKSPIAETSWEAGAISLLKDPSLVILALTMCFFEGSVHFILYSWPQTIMSARAHERIWANPPFGTIFSTLMGAMSLGSFILFYASREANSIQISSGAIQLASSISASALLLTFLLRDEFSRFWALCLFEMCVGLYFPSMTYLKGRLVQVEQKGRVYGLMRVPLNAVTFLCLTTVSEV